MDEAPFETVSRALSAFNRRDERSLRALCHPAVEWIPMRRSRAGVAYTGPDGVGRALEDLAEEFEEVRIDARRWVDVPGGLVVIGRFVAKERAGGLRLDNPGAWLVRLQEGLVSYVRAFPSEEAALAAAREGVG